MSSSLPSRFSLAGKTVLVTGSSRGLGRSMVHGLAEAGAKVAINYMHDAARAEKVAAECQERGAQAIAVQADVCTAAGVDKLLTAVREQLGPVDVLVPNAAGPQPQKPFEEYDWAFYQEMLDFFVKSPFLLTKACLPHMKEQRWGRIINIGSEVFHRGVGNFSAYVAAKGAQDGWTRSMATELAPFGVTVNILSPGWIPVERHADDPQEMKDAYRSLIPMDRWGVPDDVAGAVVFLASDAASFVTGQNLCINGGMTVG